MSLTLQNAIEQKTKFLRAFVSGGGDKHRAAQREKNKTRHAKGEGDENRAKLKWNTPSPGGKDPLITFHHKFRNKSLFSTLL